MKKLLMTLTTLFFLSGCYSAPDVVKPASWILKHVPENASVTYKKGWEDGCRSGLGNMTNSTYRAFYQFTQDETLRGNPTYYKTWKDAYTYCRHYAYGLIREGDQRPRLSNSPIDGNFLGTESILEKGALNLWGPAGANVITDNWWHGSDTNYLFHDEDASTWDFSGDWALSGTEERTFPF